MRMDTIEEEHDSVRIEDESHIKRHIMIDMSTITSITVMMIDTMQIMIDTLTYLT